MRCDEDITTGLGSALAQAHALRVGEHLKTRFRDLAQREPIIGDVRGSGLFLGIEFIQDRVTLEPATAATSWICSKMKDEHNILTSVDGAYNNVIVMKPPMCFSQEDADFVIDCLEKVLQQLKSVQLSQVMHTPT